MAEYIIATSSTSDLPRTWLEEHHIPFIAYSYTVGDKLFQDDCREESRDAVYAGMRQGDRLKTSMINEFVYYEFFKGLMDTGKESTVYTWKNRLLDSIKRLPPAKAQRYLDLVR